MQLLADFVREYCDEHGSAYHRVYSSVNLAMLAGKVLGKKDKGRLYVAPGSARRWLKGKRAARRVRPREDRAHAFKTTDPAQPEGE